MGSFTPSRLQALMRKQRPKNLPETMRWDPGSTNAVQALPLTELMPRWTSVQSVHQDYNTAISRNVEIGVGSRVFSLHHEEGNADVRITVPFRLVVTDDIGSVIEEWNWSCSWNND